MIKIKFNMSIAYFILVLMISLCSIVLCFILYSMIVSNFDNSSTIFTLVLFGIIDAISIYLLSKTDSFVQELSINENDIIFNCIYAGKRQVKSIKLEDIENFHVDVNVKYFHSKCQECYYTFSVKTKNTDEVQTFCGKHVVLLGFCSIFDIRAMIPHFTYNITSNNKELENSLFYYAENKRFNDTNIKQFNILKKIVIIGIIIYFILLFFTVYFVKS